MKKIYLPLILLTTLTARCINTTSEHEPLQIESQLLHILDGSPLLKISTILHFLDNVEKLRDGHITISKKNFDLAQLIEIEHKFPAENRDKVLVTYLTKFEAIAAPYLGDIRSARAMLIELVEHWAAQRDLPDSLLLTWSSLDSHKEKDGFIKHITSLRLFDRFLADLTLFLNDLVHSCPKSLSLYRAAEKEYNEQHGKQA